MSRSCGRTPTASLPPTRGNTPAQSALGETRRIDAVLRPLSARLADWMAALGVDGLADLSVEVDEHRGPLTRLAARAEHQMSEAEEHLAAELGVTGSSAWGRLHNDVTSQLTTRVELPTGDEVLPMPAVRGLATDADPAARRAAYDAELRAWLMIEVPISAAMNAIKGGSERAEPPTPMVVATRRIVVRQQRESCDVRCDAVGGGRRAARPAALDANQGGAARSRSRRWSPWWDLVCATALDPRRGVVGRRHQAVRSAFSGYSDRLGGLLSPLSTSDGSTPSRATARWAARSACASSRIVSRVL